MKENTDLALKLVLFTLAAVLLMALLYRLKDLCISLFLAVTLASAMAPIAAQGEKHRLPRALTVILLYAGIFLLYGVCAASLFPTAKAQAITLYNKMPDYLTHIEGWYNQLLSQAGDHAGVLSVNAGELHGLSVGLVQKTLSAGANIFESLLHAILVLFLAAYFVIESKNIWEALFHWVPPAARERCRQLIGPLESRMGGYVRGQLAVAMAVGLFLGTGFVLLGLNYAVLLGILAAVLNLVPYVGSIIACALAAVVALNQNVMVAVSVLVLYLVEQWAESTFMVPLLLGRHVSLHPLVVLFSMLIGASLMGIIGALVSVPLTAALVFLAEEFYVKPMNAASQPEAPTGN